MKALSIHSKYAYQIANKTKKIEYRTWKTNYRGEILIVSTMTDKTKSAYKDLIFGHALAVATIKTIRTQRDNEGIYYERLLSNVKPIKPIPVRGQLRLYNTKVDPEDIEYLQIPPHTDLKTVWKQNKYI